MTWEYRERDIILDIKPERQLKDWLQDGWELVGLHRKNRRGKTVVVAILRRPTPAVQRVEMQHGVIPQTRVGLS